MQNNPLITVTAAKAILAQQEFERKVVHLPLQEATGHVLAEDIFSLIDIPSFDQSSMDGYAFAFNTWNPGTTLEVVAEVPAGRTDQLMLKSGQAARVFTGAPLPGGTDTVIMQEQTAEKDGTLTILQNGLKPGDNRRLRGADIRQGELALPASSLLNEAAIGFLAGLGLTKMAVYSFPSVALLITGDELQSPGQPLKFGQVYEASSMMLKAALAQMGIHQVNVYYAKDLLPETVEALQVALQSAGVVLITGGVSVGNYDFVVRAANECGVQQLFHRVKQRPGKPLYVGRKDNQPVFGLPGNPSSVLTCFYQYVWPLLRKLSAHPDSLVMLKAPLSSAYQKNNQLTQFLKGVYRDGHVTILPAQESYRMSSFAVANCLVALNEEMRGYGENELVDLYMLPLYG